MTNEEAQAVAELVYKAQRAKESPQDIVRRLVNVGIPADKAPMVVESIDLGFKAGVNSVMTGGASDAGIVFGDNPVFDASHRLGIRQFKKMSRPWFLRPVTVTVFVIFAVLCIAYYLHVGRW